MAQKLHSKPNNALPCSSQAILQALASAPEVTEVEISPEGRWRPAGSTGRFLGAGDPYDRSTYERDACALAGPGMSRGLSMKPDPGAAEG